MNSLRLFIGLETPPDVRQKVAVIRDALAASGADVRWETTDRLHCTLLFLGSIEASIVESLADAVRGAALGIPPFAISYRGIGFFPDRTRPRVVWVGINDPSGFLLRLQKATTDAVLAIGVKGDDRPFHAHVTLGRVKSMKHLRRLTTIAETCTFEHPSVPVREISIVRSELTSSGSIYTVLRSIPLTA